MAPTVPIDYAGLRESKKFSNMVLGDVMGKARNGSKGYSGILPDYRRAVETVAESEGFWGSHRGDALLNASQDLCAPNRKYISLNGDAYGSSIIPFQLLSLSKMSTLERRDLEARLKAELEKVRKLQRKIASFSIDAVMSATTDVHGYQNEPIKKKFHPGKNGNRSKGGSVIARKSETIKQNPAQSTNVVMLMKQCETLLTRLMQHQHAWIFNEPVDTVKHNIPDYFNVIKHPMDLGTVKSKLLSNQYSNPMEFAADVRLTFKNAMTYNPPKHDVHVMAEVMSKHFEMRWKSIGKKMSLKADESSVLKPSIVVEPENACVPPAKKQKISGGNKAKIEREKRLMSDAEKQKLGVELDALLAELPDNIINFLKESSSNGSLVSDDEIEIDIDSLSDDTLFTLRKMLDDHLLDKQRKQEVSQPEKQKEFGFSSLSEKPCQADEYVDIGGNDPPPTWSSSPMNNNGVSVARKNISGDQNSNSDSDSSSTDSESSSASDIDGPKNSHPATTVNENVDTGAEQEENESHDPNNGEFLDGYAEKNSVPNPSSDELNHDRQGESDQPERQVSPEKLYRAALLRSRFADIIIKAQENTVDKGEKPDLEKLKLEREEVERRRREEKARLQAEAKAAEEARTKAEAEAAAEAKRKIELEREAARLALQQMEKTVEINENSQFMEDLEMFKSVPDEHIQGLIEDPSPESCQNGLGSFKFQASSNPLEQLGLYMKNDEEEEEVQAESIKKEAPNDPEEGEID